MCLPACIHACQTHALENPDILRALVHMLPDRALEEDSQTLQPPLSSYDPYLRFQGLGWMDMKRCKLQSVRSVGLTRDGMTAKVVHGAEARGQARTSNLVSGRAVHVGQIAVHNEAQQLHESHDEDKNGSVPMYVIDLLCTIPRWRIENSRCIF
jgi:hypothetical protein